MADVPKRGVPYIWVTWLTRLLAGEDKCWLKAWTKVHFDYEELPDEHADRLKGYTATHDAMVVEHVKAQLDDPAVARVGVEDDNAFKLTSPTAILAGKPDIVVHMKNGKARVIDAKSGKRKGADLWQVGIYLFALPLTLFRQEQPKELSGTVLYKDGIKTVEWKPENKADIVAAVKLVSAPEAPPATPSKRECGWCDIKNCASRFQGSVAEAQTDLW